MLERVLDYIHNYFEKEIRVGEYSIADGSIDLPFLKEGQYFRVRGSVFNDGVHVYGEGGLVDEDFSGEIWAMAVPPSVIALCKEIKDWVDQYGDDMSSPYQSESFGGYSYTKGAISGSGNGVSGGEGWEYVFRNRLNHWRKIS